MNRSRWFESRLRLPIVIAFVVSAGANEALAGTAPDAARLEFLRPAFEHASRVRVHTTRECVLLNEPVVSEAGVSGTFGVTRGSSITAIREEDRLVPWSEIDRVERVSSGVGRGALYGAAVGLLLGVALASQVPPDHPDPIDWGGHVGSNRGGIQTIAILFTPVSGAMLGSIVGLGFPRWKTIAP